MVIRPAVSFLSGAASDLPRGFLPMLKPTAGGHHQWVAQGRDTDSLLLSLSSWWLEQLSSNRLALDGPGSGPISASPSTQWTVRPSSIEERQEFQRQERARYSQPAQHFQWTHTAGFTTLVGPVKGLGTGRHTKQHAMLISERPAGVTILTLVRDAVSRLPNGEGTRTDIIELLKDSQYLVNELDSASLTTTVSGALDRLQNEPDASVRFDSNKKIWIYLHRDRTAEDFLAISQAKSEPSKPRKKKMKSVPSGKPETFPLDVGDGSVNKPPASILETALAGAGLGLSPALMSSPSFGFPPKAGGQSSSVGITSVLSTKSTAAAQPLQDLGSVRLGAPSTDTSSTSQSLPVKTMLSPPRQNIGTVTGSSPQLVGAELSSRMFPPAPTLASPPLNLLESPTPPKAAG